MNDVRQLVDDFATQLSTLIEEQALELARATVAAALGGRKPGRPPSTLSLLGAKPRKKPPTQLCPVPGCKNPAAPVFGMVCADHKDVPKAKIKKYREARREAKAGKGSRPARAKARKKRGRAAAKRLKARRKSGAKRSVARTKRAKKSTKKSAPKPVATKTPPPASPPPAPAVAA